MFDAQGNLTSGQPPGAWTVCRDVRIESAKVNNDRLEIKGKRIYLVYDPREKRFQDATEITDKKGKRHKVDVDDVLIEALLPPAPDDAAIQAAFNKLFYSSEQEFMEAIPPLWTGFLRRPNRQQIPIQATTDESSKAIASPSAGEQTRLVGNGILAPALIFSPDPAYNSEARKAKFEGTTVLTIIVDREGRVHNVRVARPLGLGLDERAAEKISTWRFNPALKGGKPVIVEVNVEVSFNLY